MKMRNNNNSNNKHKNLHRNKMNMSNGKRFMFKIDNFNVIENEWK